MKIRYTVYSQILDATFEHEGEFENMGAFRLYAHALYSGNWSIKAD